MSILKIARMGHPVLRKKAQPIDPGDLKSAAVQKLIDDMMETMHEYRGIGLAAQQVHESLRLFVAGLPTGPETDEGEPEYEIVALVNPEIKPVGSEVSEDWEGCLSIPDIRGRVERPRRVRVRALDRRGRRIEFEATNYAGRVLQHENDHLDGVLFLDRITRHDSLTYLEELERFHRDEREAAGA